MNTGILGATGQAGQAIARWLARAGFSEITLIGRNREKLANLRAGLSSLTAQAPAIAVAGATSQADLEKAFQSIDLAVIAVSSFDLLPTIVRAALNTHTDCLDILLCSESKRDFLRAHREIFLKSGITYITDGGYHPGVPAAMARWGESMCPGLHTANIHGSFGVDWRGRNLAFDTMVDFVREMNAMDMGILKDGKWVSGWRNMTKFDFRDGRGVQDCAAMGMDEMRELPRYLPTLANAGFYIAGFGRVVDWGIMPLSMLVLKGFPRAIRGVTRFFAWGLRTFTENREWANLHLQGESTQGSVEMVITYPDAYELTALPVVACLKQYAQLSKRPGLHRQAFYVDPCEFFDDLRAMGVTIEQRRNGCAIG